MWKSGYTKHLEDEIIRLRLEIASYRKENGRLVDRLLMKNAVTPIQDEEAPIGSLLDRGGLFDDEDEPTDSDPFASDNRKAIHELAR